MSSTSALKKAPLAFSGTGSVVDALNPEKVLSLRSKFAPTQYLCWVKAFELTPTHDPVILLSSEKIFFSHSVLVHTCTGSVEDAPNPDKVLSRRLNQKSSESEKQVCSDSVLVLG